MKFLSYIKLAIYCLCFTHTAYSASAQTLEDTTLSENGNKLIVSSPVKAQIYFQKAIRHGYKKSTIDLASLYASPQFSPEGHMIARMFFDAAISYGEPYGYIGLGYMHEKGLSFPKNLDMAISFYQKAIIQNESTGYIFLAELKENNPQQINYAEIADLYIQAAHHGNPLGVFGLIHLYEKHPRELNLSHKDIIFWSYVQYFIYPKLEMRIDKSFFDLLPSLEIKQIKIKAEAFVKSLSSNK